MKRLIYAVLATAVALSVCGCANVRKKTSRDKVYPHMFSNDLSLLLTNFARIKRGETTREDLKRMRFDLKAKNVREIEGVGAFRELFGQEAFRNVDPEKFERLLPELNLYTLYEIPYKDVTVVSDRLYVNRQKTVKQGPDTMFTIIVRNGLVVYAGKREVHNDTEEYRRRFLGGIVDVLGEFGGAISSAARLSTAGP